MVNIATPSFMFETVQLMDKIRHRNRCGLYICHDEENCVCWGDLQKALKGKNDPCLITGKRPWSDAATTELEAVGRYLEAVRKMERGEETDNAME